MQSKIVSTTSSACSAVILPFLGHALDKAGSGHGLLSVRYLRVRASLTAAATPSLAAILFTRARAVGRSDRRAPM